MPRLPLQHEKTYHALYLQAGKKIDTVAYKVPPAPAAPPAEVVNVWPTADVLPAMPPVKTLTATERIELAAALQRCADRLGLDPPAHADAEALLALIDQHLTRQDRQRNPRPINSFGPLEWQLRVLLWKQGVADYAKPDAGPLDLVERLDKKLRDKR